jgi:phosphoglycerate kinase
MIRYLSKTKLSLLSGTALVRLDFNTEDNWRMLAVLPTIKLLLKTSDKIVIMSHRGRPESVSDAQAKAGKLDKKFSLRKNAATLTSILNRKVIFIDHFDFPKITAIIEKSPKGSIFLLENLRFNAGEEKNDSKFAKQLASLADFYVNDAFAVDHRANASVVAITKFLPSYAGIELETEIDSLSRAMKKPKHPFVFIVGGAKAADKLDAISFFKNKADWFLLGGGSANTTLYLRGMDVKKSLRDTDPKTLKAIQPLVNFKKMVIPEDFVWGGERILDIGPETTKRFVGIIAKAETIIWSGPLGFVEKSPYAKASLALASAIAKNHKAFSLTGGGETVMFLKKYKLDKKFSFISTGGGAMIDFLAGKKLPGIEALR